MKYFLEVQKPSGIVDSTCDASRVCPGQFYAISELKTVIATLVRELKFELADDSPLDTHWAISAHPKNETTLNQ